MRRRSSQRQLIVRAYCISSINPVKTFKSLHRLLMGYTRTRLIGIGELAILLARKEQADIQTPDDISTTP
jgi:hypothetical protein